MYKIPAKTIFIGKNIVFVPECHSTNSLALEMSQNKDLDEGTLIITDHQKQGRGQPGNLWLSAQGMNLTFSIIFKPVFMAIQDQFYLNMSISLGVKGFLENKLKRPVYIKWPNDLLVDDLKLCGILTENQIQGTTLLQSIVGIGLNVNQQDYTIQRAASMRMLLGHEFDLQELLEELCISLEQWYQLLRLGEITEIKAAYRASLYGLDKPRIFSDKSDHFEGTIKGVDRYGRLAMATSMGMRYFSNRELRYEY